MNPEYKKEFDIPDHEDFQVSGKYNSQKSFAVKGVVEINHHLYSSLSLSLKRFCMVTGGFVDVEHNCTNQCTLSLINIFTFIV